MKKVSLILLVVATIIASYPCLTVWAGDIPRTKGSNVKKDTNNFNNVDASPLEFVAIRKLPPMSYTVDGMQVGIIVDIAEAIKKAFTRPVELKYMDWSEAQQLVLNGEADALFHINPSEKRKQIFDFSDGLLQTDFSIFVNEGREDIYDIHGLKGLRVGVLNKGLAFNLLTQDPRINLVTYPDILKGYISLEKGNLDAVVMERPAGTFILAENKIRGIRITGNPIDSSLSAIAVKKGNTQLLAEINRTLSAIKEDGTYSEILANWQPKEVVFQTREQFRTQKRIIVTLTIVSGMAVLSIVLAILWNKSLKSKVSARTNELAKTNNSLLIEIDERRKIESELRASRDFLENLTDAIGDVIFSIKMPDRQMEWISDRFEIIGYTQEECLGRETEFFYANKSDFLAIGEKIDKAAAEGEVLVTTEAYLKRKNGEIFPGEANLTLVRNNNKVVSLIGSLRDVSVRKQDEEKILEYQKRLKTMASQLTIAEERERRIVAIDLHDNVAQSLALLRMQIASVQKKISEPILRGKLEDISGTLLQTLQQTRNLMLDLSSPSIYEIGLLAAISEWIEVNIINRYNLKAEFIDSIKDHDLDFLKEDIQVILFRNVRELLINIVKHARAENVMVDVRIAGKQLKISVKDDGIGFNSGIIKRENGEDISFGLFSIKERMSDAGGTLEIISAPNKGCTAIMTIPVATL